MALKALEQLGKPRISWVNLMSWETEILSSLVQELEGVSVFVCRI